jgi:hypothetical protein
VGRQGAADALVHHREVVVRERLIIYRTPPYEKAVAGWVSDGSPIRTRRDHQNVAMMVRKNG